MNIDPTVHRERVALGEERAYLIRRLAGVLHTAHPLTAFSVIDAIEEDTLEVYTRPGVAEFYDTHSPLSVHATADFDRVAAFPSPDHEAEWIRQT